MEKSSEDIRDCTVTFTESVIAIMCSYSSDSTAIGFQVIVQMEQHAETGVLLINRTTEHLSSGPVTIQVEDKNGKYRVAVFPLKREGGIVNATVEYTQELSTGGMLLTIN